MLYNILQAPSVVAKGTCGVGLCGAQTFHFKLHTALHTPKSTLNTAHSKVHTQHCTLQNPHSTLHTPKSTLNTSHSKVHTQHCTLQIPHSKPHTAHSKVDTGTVGSRRSICLSTPGLQQLLHHTYNMQCQLAEHQTQTNQTHLEQVRHKWPNQKIFVPLRTNWDTPVCIRTHLDQSEPVLTNWEVIGSI